MANAVSQEYHPSLPLEIWIKIFKMLPREAALTCLSVNRLLHDIILPIVFARVVLRFTPFEAVCYPPAVLLHNGDRLHLLEDDVRRHAQELLGRIVSDASFAAAVRTLQIQAYPLRNITEAERQRAVRAPMVWDWIDRVSAAITLLKNLRTFSWHGRSPPPSNVVVQQLARSCPFLECFEAPFYNMDLISLRCLKGIKKIRPATSGEDTLDREAYLRDPVPILKLFHRTLQHSTFDSNDSPYRLLDTITDLELLFVDDGPEDIEDILHGVPQLESLSMVHFDMWNDTQQERMYQGLLAIPSHLTCFHSLAIGPGGGGLEQAQLDVLCDFLIGRPQLRRLAVRSIFTATDAELFFSSIKTLDELDALALTFDCEDLPAAEWLDLLATHVPSRLSVLALEFHDGFANKDTFVELWARLPCLRFIYVKLRFGLTVLTPNQFIRGASDDLRIVCYQDRFYDVEWTTDGPRVVLPPWPSYKVRFRMTEDFEDANIEWLMRYYTFSDYLPASW